MHYMHTHIYLVYLTRYTKKRFMLNSGPDFGCIPNVNWPIFSMEKCFETHDIMCEDPKICNTSGL